ncbi:nitroreductase [Nocardioides sp. LHD-245]|uniref:nitroreductase n=1 Tax=Nocardioides sp. LHD-245 TaxID=3051387 RepID=UPI0027E21423|nr:nitroreductase [Nocardioides sp. LHD-245]
MDFATLMKTRWSCRGYRPDEVPEEMLTRVLATAQRTGSWCNVQPWHVRLLRGEATRWLARELTAHVSSHPDAADQTPDLELPGTYAGVHLERRREAGYALYRSLGIERTDHAARAAAMLDNYSFFGAPVALIVTVERSQGAYAAADCGAFVANLMNAALDEGLGTIAQGALGVYAGKVRELLEIPEHEAVLCGVALGYPDEEHPSNGFRTERASLSDIVTEVRR